MPRDAICDQCDKYIGDDKLAYFSDAENNLDFCSEGCYSIWEKWENIRPNFTPELQKEWEVRGFSYEECKGWIDIGCNFTDYKFASYLKKNDFNAKWVSEYNVLNDLKEEYAGCCVQEWLDRNYPKEKREWIEEVHLNKPSLEGELDLKDFTYQWLRVYISPQVDETKLIFKNKSEMAEIILRNPQKHIQQEYPNRIEWIRVTELDIGQKNLKGNLDLSDFFNLKKLDCSENKLIFLDVNNCSYLIELNCEYNSLTDIVLPTNPTNLKLLNISNNNFFPSDLSFLIPYTNLEELRLGNNKFTGSLDYLSNLKQLRKLLIIKTDIDKVDVNKLPENLEMIKYESSIIEKEHIDDFKKWIKDCAFLDILKALDMLKAIETWEKPFCKLNKIIPQLREYEWKDIHNDFTLKLRKKWEKLGFNKDQTKKWIRKGLNLQDCKFISYLKEGKNFSLEQILNNINNIKFKELRNKCNDFDWCRQCQQVNNLVDWCQSCTKKKWTLYIKQLAEPKVIEKLIEENPHLKWIPYNKLKIKKDKNGNDKVLGEGGFSKVYEASWSGLKEGLDSGDKNDKIVALKILHNSQNITLEFLNEITNYYFFSYTIVTQLYGISRDPQTKNYVMVMEYKNKNLRQVSKQIGSGVDEWKLKLCRLNSIVKGLIFIHKKGLVHRDFHSGNMLCSAWDSARSCHITDLGLCRPVNEKEKEGKIYGVLPYMAPEVLRGKPYTQASDIYSLGIVMYEMFSGVSPYHNVPHDLHLSLKICQGLRPQFNFQLKIPILLENLIKKCWDGNPNQRPNAYELIKILKDWGVEEGGWMKREDTELACQIKKAESFNKNLPDEVKFPWWFPDYKTHPQAGYISKPINTKQITELLKKSEEIIASKSVDFDIDEFDNFLKDQGEERNNQNNSNWTNINPNFTEELIQNWQHLSFTPTQTTDWLSIDLQPTESNFAAYLRDQKQLTPETALNQADYEQLKSEYQNYQTQQEQPPK